MRLAQLVGSNSIDKKFMGSIHVGRLSMIGHLQIPLLVVALTEAYGMP